MGPLREIRAIGNQWIQAAKVAAHKFKGASPNIILDFYQRDELGAACKKSKQFANTYYIGISQGLPYRLRELYSPLVSTGRPLSWLLERPGQVKDSGHSMEPDPGLGDELTTLLCNEALQFLLNHELGHILNGHLGYKEESTGEGALADNNSECMALDPITQQTLEMDADSLAVSSGLTSMITRLDGPSAGPPEFCTPQGIVFIWELSIYVLFRYFARPGPIFEEIHSLSHTPPQLRAFQAFGIFADCLFGRKIGTSFEPYSPAVDTILAQIEAGGDAIAVAEWALADIRQESPDLVPLQQAVSEEAKELLLLTYYKVWAQVQPHLLPHAFIKIAPPEPKSVRHPNQNQSTTGPKR